MLLQVLVLALVLVVVLGGGQQAGDMADAFSDALPEEQLGAQSQVLWVFDEAEANHGTLAGAQLVLQQRQRCSYTQEATRWRAGHELITTYTPTFP